MKEVESQPWYRSYASAIVELDPQKLVQQMDATEAAIDGRLRDLQFDSDHHEERKMIGDAQRTLEFLRKQASLRRPKN